MRTEELGLLDFGRGVARDDGTAAWLDDDGVPDAGHASETWLTARMAHVYYLGSLRGVPGCLPIARQLMRGLDGVVRDSVNGGWDTEVPATEGTDKSAYAHAFVVLAGATGTMAGDIAALRVLDEALEVVDAQFWEPEFGLFADTWSRDWSAKDGYRGVNANMHMVEAMLAASDATGEPKWASRALGVCEWVAARAQGNGWRVPEHFDAGWVADLEFNREHPADQFKPYGATVGHAFEWSRLMMQASTLASDPSPLVAAARALFAGAVRDGWAPDGQPGFVYTTDWSGAPIVSDRLHWVAAEAIGAAAVLTAAFPEGGTGEASYSDLYADWWDYVAQYVVDRERGSWRHQLDANNDPASSVWDGKPDIYHAYQAVLISQLPTSTSIARAIADGDKKEWA
ncbi:MAG TPA: AGE family epimerase/isomerase [Galbitalea sp.]